MQIPPFLYQYLFFQNHLANLTVYFDYSKLAKSDAVCVFHCSNYQKANHHSSKCHSQIILLRFYAPNVEKIIPLKLVQNINRLQTVSCAKMPKIVTIICSTVVTVPSTILITNVHSQSWLRFWLIKILKTNTFFKICQFNIRKNFDLTCIQEPNFRNNRFSLSFNTCFVGHTHADTRAISIYNRKHINLLECLRNKTTHLHLVEIFLAVLVLR